jgi:hypothetical protein
MKPTIQSSVFRLLSAATSSDLLRKTFSSRSPDIFNEEIADSGFADLNSYLEGNRLDFENNLAMKPRGHDWVRSASHNVYLVKRKKEGGVHSVVKLMNDAYIGFDQEKKSYEPSEARRQAVLEVLSAKVGNLLCPNQFSQSEVATGVLGGVKTYAVASVFIPRTVSVRSVREGNGLDMEDRDDGVFYLEPSNGSSLQTRAHIERASVERMKLSMDLRREMNRPGYEINDAIVEGRVGLKMAMYVLGEVDEVHNRDGNVLLKAASFHVDHEKKTITPEVVPVAIDCGLCLRADSSRDRIEEKAYKLATRENDSRTMGLELSLDGQYPSNVKPCKEKFLKNLVKVYESGKIDQHVNWASPYLRHDDLGAIEAMKARLDICYLAGKCIEAGLDKSEKKNEARLFLREKLAEIENSRGISAQGAQR